MLFLQSTNLASQDTLKKGFGLAFAVKGFVINQTK
jgi:hypothetical protein